MPFLKVAKLGKSVLRKIAQPVTRSEFHTPDFQKFLDDMVETMRHLKGVGLAAPQVYRSKRVIVVERPGNPLLILLNPKITFFSEESEEAFEGCLSLDNLRGKVLRSSRVKAVGFDRRMKPVELEAEGYFARVLQHEIDHLNGKVFTDRMTDLTSLILRSNPTPAIISSTSEKERRSLALTLTYHSPAQTVPDQTLIESGKATFLYTL